METIEVAYLPIWRRYLEVFEEAELSNREIGILVYAMMEYQFRGKLPTKLPAGLKIVWSLVRSDLDCARARYETAVQNGRKGGRKKKQKEPTQTQQNQKEGITITESISQTNTKTMQTEEKEQPGSSADAEDLCLKKLSYGEFGWVKLTQEQYKELERLMGKTELARWIKYLDQSAQRTRNSNQWSDWDQLLRSCFEKGQNR